MSKNFWQGCQISFYMSRGPFWGIIYFSGKSRFFSIIFECWVIFFWRVRHNCMLRVRILLEGKQFFSKIFFTTFRKWAWFFPAFGKKTSAGCHEGNPHVRKNGLRLKFVWKKGFFYFGFVHWGKDFLPSEKNWVKCHKCSLHAHWYSLMKIFVWKFLFFCRFWTLLIIFRPFAQRFSKPLSEVLLTVQRKILRKLLVWKNLFFLYLQYRAKNFWHFVVESFSVVWKMAFYVSRGTIWGRMCLLFWKKSCFFSAFVHRDFFCGFSQIIFGSVVKKAFYVSIE